MLKVGIDSVGLDSSDIKRGMVQLTQLTWLSYNSFIFYNSISFWFCLGSITSVRNGLINIKPFNQMSTVDIAVQPSQQNLLQLKNGSMKLKHQNVQGRF